MAPCYLRREQQSVPVHFVPLPTHASAEPAAHENVEGTQHWAPVHTPLAAWHASGVPLVQVAPPEKQHCEPVHPPLSCLHCLLVPATHVMTAGKQHFLPDHLASRTVVQSACVPATQIALAASIVAGSSLLRSSLAPQPVTRRSEIRSLMRDIVALDRASANRIVAEMPS